MAKTTPLTTLVDLAQNDTDAAARVYCKGNEVTVEKTVREDGTILYEIVADGLHQRLSFTPD